MSSPNTHKGASVKSADRVIAILELFAHRQKPLNLTEIASELGYPMSSVLALLKSLCASEYLRFNQESKTYMPTLRVPMLGSWIMGELFQNGSIIALMDQIQKETSETVILGARNGLHAQYLHTVQSQRLLRYYQKPGQVRPMTQSAVGKALLMQFTNNEISHFILQLNQNTTLERTLVKEQNILEDIRKARQAGYAMTDRLTQGICASRSVIATLWRDTLCHCRCRPKLSDQTERRQDSYHYPSTLRDVPERRFSNWTSPC